MAFIAGVLLAIALFTFSANPLSAKTLYVGGENCSDSVQCLLQHQQEAIQCCSLEYISRRLKDSCSNLTIIIETPLLRLNGLVSFERCSNISIIGGREDAASIITCQEKHREQVMTNEHKLNDPLKDTWSTSKPYVFSSFKLRPDKSEPLRVNNQQAKLTMNDSPGFYFGHVSGLLVRNVKVMKCGPVRIKHAIDTCNSSFLLVNCSNVNVSHSHFENSSYTGVYFINMNGYVKLTNVSFVKNQQRTIAPQKTAKVFPSGLLVHYESAQDGTAHFSITNCTFDTNYTPHIYEFEPNLTPTLKDWMSYGLGGAVGLIFMNRVHGISVNIIDSHFINNTGVWGAGLCIQFQQQSYNNSVSIMKTEFRNNYATMAGGGVNVRFGKIKNVHNMTMINSVSFHSSLFQNNTGSYGGGVLVFASASDIETLPGSMVSFMECQWVNNYGRYSPAVDISPFRFDENSNGFLPIPTFTGCTFAHNKIVYKTKNHTVFINSGVFVVTHFEVQFSGHINFSNNSLTALYITWGRAIFNSGCSVRFIDNIGIRGGAVALFGFSILGLKDNSSFNFITNHATAVGGGIFYESAEQREYFEGRRCFLEYMGKTENVAKRNLTFIFQNNTAEESGSSIYSASFYACYFRYYGNLKGRNITDFFRKIGTFIFNNKTKLGNELFGTYGMVFAPKAENLYTVPGMKFKLNVQLLDEFDTVLAKNYEVKIDGDSSLKLKSNYTSDGSVNVMGPPNKKANLIVSTLHPIRSVHCQLKLSLNSCPPGLYYNETYSTCSCSADNPKQSYSAITKCNYSSFRAYIDHGYWAGYYHKDSYSPSNLYTALCPMQFCSTSTFLQSSKELPETGKSLAQAMCQNRQGLLCGFCSDGLSIYFHSRYFSCGKETLCSYGMIFYLISELIPVVFIFSVIILSNFSFTSGNVNGLILFSQCLDIVAINFKDYQNERLHTLPISFQLQRFLQKTYVILYDVSNLDFFRAEELSFCIFKTRGVMPIVAIKYVTTMFAFFLVICLVALLNSSRCERFCLRARRGKVNASYIHGISAFLVLCYAQCTRITFFILTWAHIIGNSEADPQTVTVTYFGGLHYFGKDHVPYALLALLCLCTIVILPPFLLIAYPLVLQLLGKCGLSEHRIVLLILKLSQIHRLVPMLDSFQASFKDEMRCFAGFYFLYRVALLAVYSFKRSSTVYCALSEFLLISFLGIHAVAQPYVKPLHNVIDGFLFANLAVINGLSAYATVTVQDKQLHGRQRDIKPPLYTGFIQLVLIYLPLIIALGALTKKCYVTCCKKSCSTRNGVNEPTPEEERSFLSNVLH